MKHIKGSLCAAAIGLMLIVQLLQPASVFADGEGTPLPTSTPALTETPQPTETVVETVLPSGTPENTVTPEETTSPTDVPAATPTPDPIESTVEPVVVTPIAPEFATPGTEEPTVEPVAATPAPTEIPTEEEDETKVAPTDASTPTAEPVVSEDDIIVEEPSLAEMLSEIPAETEVVILNENGQPEPLATVEAAEAVSSGGPVWCPVGQIPGGPGCSTATYTNLSDLVANFVPTGDGTIYIASGNDSSTSAIVIDGTGNWAAASNYLLNIQGGFIEVNEGGMVIVGPNSVLPVDISIINWNNGVDIRRLDASSINLANITSDRGSNVVISDTGSNVNLNDIHIDGSRYDGLAVNTTGSIQGANITSNNNQGYGATLGSTQVITLTGTNAFNNNGYAGFYSGSGLYDLFAPEYVLLNNITSNGNGSVGVWTYGSTNITMNNVIANDNGNTGVLTEEITNITMNNVIANDNGRYGIYTGVYTDEITNFTMNNVIANGNVQGGVWTNGITNITMNNVMANNNTSVGIILTNVGNISLTGGEVTQNGVGLYVNCVNGLQFNLPLTNISGNTIQDILIDTDCPSPIIETATPVAPQVQVQGKFTLDCSKQAAYPVQLPNGDLVNIFCPVSGTASIYRLDNTNLPENLPEGYTYASAFTLDIAQRGVPIPVITEGGYVKSSFVAQPLQAGNTYTVLYWDPWVNKNGELVENPAGGNWVPLKDFLLDGNGNTTSFDLFPGTDDPRKVISGVNLVNHNGSESIEVSTNFPGIFVLAQH